MEEFIKADGLFWVTAVLVIVTFWYAYATFRMSSIMRTEALMKTTPRLGAMKPRVASSAWQHFTAEQYVVNTGLSAIFIEWAALEWWAYDMQKRRHSAVPKEPLPILLAPGKRTKFTFEVEQRDLAQYVQPAVAESAATVTGLVIYRYSGVEGEPQMREFNLPEPVATTLERLEP